MRCNSTLTVPDGAWDNLTALSGEPNFRAAPGAIHFPFEIPVWHSMSLPRLSAATSH